ncbi:LytTR family DNA-binding domain-containing protein [Gangjinia marincola]|uniref:LytTR family DNA-binding domain-containing protein n=1 Tax=Gangjinia marincola TaxID=578463 RepID=A0ABN1MIP2_9FLAO
MRYKVMIVDDERTAREILVRHLAEESEVEVVAECTNAIEAMQYVKANTVDLVFLDINMPEISGLAFAKVLEQDTPVIFTTAHREYAVEGFELQAVDYLLKPIAKERLQQAIAKLVGRVHVPLPPSVASKESADAFVFVRENRKMTKIEFEDIVFVESLSDYIKIHLTDKTVVTRETISAFEGKLPGSAFLRIHRSFIVSLAAITGYTNETVEVSGKALPISRSYRAEVVARLSSFE